MVLTYNTNMNTIYEVVDVNSYDPGLLESGKTFYWRVDEVNTPPDSTIFKGAVWSRCIQSNVVNVQCTSGPIAINPNSQLRDILQVHA